MAPLVIIGLLATTCVTVAVSAGMVTKDVWIGPCSVMVETTVSVSISAATLWVTVMVNGVGVVVDTMVWMTVVVVVDISLGEPVGAPPSTGTTEYDALGLKGGPAALG
jgi:hypothetical protein